MHGNKKPIEARFMGTARSWQITCSECSATKIIESAGRRLPPNIIIKKARQAGWFVGNKAKDDLCLKCYRKPVAKAAVQAKKILAQMVAPMMTNGQGHTIHYSEIEAIALKLPHEQIRQLIKALRDALPTPSKPPKAQKTPIVVESDVEYAKWLEGLN